MRERLRVRDDDAGTDLRIENGVSCGQRLRRPVDPGAEHRIRHERLRVQWPER